MRLRWSGDGEPGLGDLAMETTHSGGDPDVLRRAYEVVGVEEPGRAGAAWGVILERLDWMAGCERELAGARTWTFYRDTR